MGSLSVHAFHFSHSCFASSWLTHFLCLSSMFSLFIFYVFFISYFSIFLCFLLFLLVVVYYAWLRPFYTTCRDKIYHFTPQLLLPCCGYPSRTAHWSTGYPATTTTLCWPHHASFSDKRSFVLFSYFPWHSHPDKGWVSLLLTPIACT